MAISQVSDITGYFNNIYNDTLFVARETAIMSQLVTPLSAQGWATRTVPIYNQFSAIEVAENVDFQNPTTLSKSTEATFTPKEIMVQAVVTDRRIETDPDNTRNAVAREMGSAISEKIDTDLLNLFDNFDTTKGTANNSLTIAILAAALSKLRDNKVMGPRFGVLHPYQWHDIWTLLGQPATQQAFLGDAANQALRDYFVSNILACSWFVSANIATDANDDAYGAVFVREALGLDTRKSPTAEIERDASLRAWEYNLSAGYAVAVHRGDYGVGIISDVTEPS